MEAKIGSSFKKDKCIITVADDGVGATDEQIERLNPYPATIKGKMNR